MLLTKTLGSQVTFIINPFVPLKNNTMQMCECKKFWKHLKPSQKTDVYVQTTMVATLYHKVLNFTVF
jgi:hypothetical protein